MRKALGEQSFDALVCFTPCVTVAAQLRWATKHWRMRNMLFVHDFFPYHHRSIGLVPGGPVFEIARRLEEHLIRKFHVIGCIWPGNIGYLRKHYRIRPEQRVIWTPLWGEIAPPPARPKEIARRELGLPMDRKISCSAARSRRGVESRICSPRRHWLKRCGQTLPSCCRRWAACSPDRAADRVRRQQCHAIAAHSARRLSGAARRLRRRA